MAEKRKFAPTQNDEEAMNELIALGKRMKGQKPMSQEEVIAFSQKADPMQAMAHASMAQPAPMAPAPGQSAQNPAAPIHAMLAKSAPQSPIDYTLQAINLQNKQLLGTMKEREKGYKKTRGMIEEAEKGQAKINLAPLLAMSDWLTGGNISKYYQAPESAEDRQARIMGLEQLAQQQLGGLTDDQIAMMKLGIMKEQYAKKGGGLMPGEAARDKAFGKTINEWEDAGGYANAASNLQKLKGAVNMLRAPGGADLAGTAMPEWIRAFSNPSSVEAQRDVRSVAEQSMKQILGAQFTEREGKRLIENLYDPKLSAEMNARRVEVLANSLEKQALAKQEAMDYFNNNNGTMKGFRGGSAKTFADINVDMENEVRNAINEITGKQAPAKAAPAEGATHEHNGVKWKVQNGNWVKVQ